MDKKMKKIYLFNAGKKVNTQMNMPVAMLHVASKIIKEYDVKIIDTRVEEYEHLDFEDVLYCGITSITGKQIIDSIEVCKFIREKTDAPIVWGGIHPSSLPKQTCEHSMVDIVCMGEGEETALHLAHAIENGTPLKEVKGIAFFEGDEYVETEQRDFIDMNEIDLPYHLIDVNKYEIKDIISLHTSRGCPYKCIYCHQRVYNKTSYRSMNAIKVVDEIERVLKLSDANRIGFNEDNFFLSKKRVTEICNEIKKRNLNIEWDALGRADDLARYDDEFFQMLVESGCVAVSVGAESGSEKILEYVKKGTKLSDNYKMLERCNQFGISVLINTVIGFPNETKEDVYKTLSFIEDRGKIDGHSQSSHLFTFIPFPNTPIMGDAIKSGFKPPTSLEGWGKYSYSSAEAVGLFDKKYCQFLDTVATLTLFGFDRGHSTKNIVKKIAIKLLTFSAKTRFRYRFFSFPIEWKIFTFMKKRMTDWYGTK